MEGGELHALAQRARAPVLVDVDRVVVQRGEGELRARAQLAEAVGGQCLASQNHHYRADGSKFRSFFKSRFFRSIIKFRSILRKCWVTSSFFRPTSEPSDKHCRGRRRRCCRCRRRRSRRPMFFFVRIKRIKRIKFFLCIKRIKGGGCINVSKGGGCINVSKQEAATHFQEAATRRQEVATRQRKTIIPKETIIPNGISKVAFGFKCCMLRRRREIFENTVPN